MRFAACVQLDVTVMDGMCCLDEMQTHRKRRKLVICKPPISVVQALSFAREDVMHQFAILRECFCCAGEQRATLRFTTGWL